jgi:hypothetical protein
MNVLETDTTGPEQLESAQLQVEAAHEKYSDAFHRREDAEKDLAACAAQRAALVRELKTTQRSVEAAILDAIQSAINDPASADASEATAKCTKVDLLKRSLQKYSAFEYADSERALLAATVDELTLQKWLEESRVAHQEQDVLLKLSSVAEDLQVNSLGSMIEAMRKNIHEIGQRLERAREELRQHDEVTATARATYEKDQNTWLK